MLNSKLPRPLIRQRIQPWIGSALIKVITGQRRVGKSSFLASLAFEFEAASGSAPLFVQLESAEWRHIRTADDLLAMAQKHAPSGPAILMIDEVQEIEDFDLALRSLAAEERWDLYVTGSNAELLSGEIATRFAGRSITIEVPPLSYDEFLVFHRQEDSDESLRKFLRYGGLPFLHHLPLEDETVFGYLGEVAQTAILKDIVQRHGVKNHDLLARLVTFLADSVGSPVSANSIARFLKSQRVAASVPTILDHIHHLEQAYLVRRTKRQDLTGKKILEVSEKHYFEDLGIRSVLLDRTKADPSQIVENAVHHRLVVDGWKIQTGDLNGREIDFVCQRGSDRMYVQATYVMTDASTREREFGNLLALPDNHPKLVVSMDPWIQDDRGVKHLSLRTFLHDGWG
ncbi:MAG: ATP-binding protein [Fibrobacterota bacterium]|nr:MAG: ATP-binding protein [Fibrobacterota bacterium]